MNLVIQDASCKSQENRPDRPDRTNRLENLVPDLELCRKIPEGAFEDSALVWEEYINFEGKQGYYVDAREWAESGIPAPTLEEILIAQSRIVLIFQYNYDYDTSIWRGIWRAEVFYSQQGPISKYDCKPVNAALKLWLELNTI